MTQEETSETEPWRDQQAELDFERPMSEIDSALRCAEGAQNREDFVVSLDDAICDLETLLRELRELKRQS